MSCERRLGAQSRQDFEFVGSAVRPLSVFKSSNVFNGLCVVSKDHRFEVFYLIKFMLLFPCLFTSFPAQITSIFLVCCQFPGVPIASLLSLTGGFRIPERVVFPTEYFYFPVQSQSTIISCGCFISACANLKWRSAMCMRRASAVGITRTSGCPSFF